MQSLLSYHYREKGPGFDRGAYVGEMNTSLLKCWNVCIQKLIATVLLSEVILFVILIRLTSFSL